MHFLEVRDVSFAEHGAVVIHPLSFVQQEGQKLALAGESGAGKSTVLQLIAGLVQPSTGQVLVQGSRVRDPAVALVPGHPGVAYLSQRSDLPKFLRVEQVLQYAGRQATVDAHTLYKVCRIDHLLMRRTDQLSGGEQQRVALARLLLGTPKLLLLDEPFSNLDRAHKQTMQAILTELSERLGITCLLVSHDATDTLSWADELLVLRRGHLVQRGTPTHLYNQPVDEYTAALLGDYNLVRGADRYALSPGAPGAHTLVIRPEHFRLERMEQGALPGVVRAVRFFGSYYEVELALPENVVRARVGTPTVVPGDTVGVALAAGSAWAIG